MKVIQITDEAIKVLDKIRQENANTLGKPASYTFAVLELNERSKRNHHEQNEIP